MKNRKREICTSGSVRDEDGQPPHLLGRRDFLHLAAGAAALPAVSCIARAQAYPSRPVRIVVGFPPAGGADIFARLMGQWLSERLGQQFIIENRPGAASNIATETVVRAPADGYTLLLVTNPNVINATLYDKLNYNLIRDIAPVASIDRVPNVMEVHPSVPTRTVPEFIAYAKANPATPPELIDKLNKEINAGLADPTIKARIAELGSVPMRMTPADFGTLIAEETEKWGRVVKFAGVKAD